MIRELTVSEVEQVSGAGPFGAIWGGVKWLWKHRGDVITIVTAVVGAAPALNQAIGEGMDRSRSSGGIGGGWWPF